MFISLMWEVKEPTHYSKRVGHEVPGVVTVLCESMGGYREGDIPCMGLGVLFVDCITWHFSAKAVEKHLVQRKDHIHGAPATPEAALCLR